MAAQSSKKRTLLCIVIPLLLLLAAGYLLMWHRIRTKLQDAEAEAQYAVFTLDDAVYEECSLGIVQLYAPEITGITKEICGESAGSARFSEEEYPLYRLLALEAEGKRDGILVMEKEGVLRCYELTGFLSLADSPSITDVCQVYGIQSAEDIRSVSVTEADGTPIDTMTNSEDISGFYQKFAALGESLSDAEQAKAYYDVYAEKYGDTDDLTIEGASLTANSEEANERAYALWGEGMCMVGLELSNGLRISDMVYAPVPRIFSVFGNYRLTEAFFS